MNVKVPGWVLLILSVISSFIKGAGGVVAAALYVLPRDAPLPFEVWIGALVFGLMTCADDTRKLLGLSPVEVERPPVPLPLDKPEVTA